MTTTHHKPPIMCECCGIRPATLRPGARVCEKCAATGAIHRALSAQGFDEKQRAGIIAYCANWARAGIAVDPVEVGGAIARYRDGG